ncbi:MAG TPA: XRE family transcriptional regulator [Phycisphaerae bacterium]|nr:XRE family transcriptional regulator [Phycisphaerae bacterium]HDZ42973.1 XRE family transcriptional regulator [Phycisphaerae bacterium]
MAKKKARDSIADRLRSAREMAGLSQAQVARILHVHRPTITEMEAGRRKVSADELRQLAELYEVDIAWLAGSQSTENQPGVELAARELAKLKKDDLDRVLQLLQSLRRGKGAARE